MEEPEGAFSTSVGRKNLRVSYIRVLILRTMTDSSRDLPFPLPLQDACV